jgi:hypothetical protein
MPVYPGAQWLTAQPYTTQFADSLRWFPRRNSGKGKSRLATIQERPQNAGLKTIWEWTTL